MCVCVLVGFSWSHQRWLQRRPRLKGPERGLFFPTKCCYFVPLLTTTRELFFTFRKWLKKQRAPNLAALQSSQEAVATAIVMLILATSKHSHLHPFWAPITRSCCFFFLWIRRAPEPSINRRGAAHFSAVFCLPIARLIMVDNCFSPTSFL